MESQEPKDSEDRESPNDDFFEGMKSLTTLRRSTSHLTLIYHIFTSSILTLLHKWLSKAPRSPVQKLLDQPFEDALVLGADECSSLFVIRQGSNKRPDGFMFARTFNGRAPGMREVEVEGV
jgi:hypothetical protein